jgi:ketosteroid isomerase-like protein
MKRRKQLNGSAAEVEAAFYDALNRADIEALMLLWADDDDVVCIHPGGARLHGIAAIHASWQVLFEHGPLALRPMQPRETHTLMSAVRTVIEGPAVSDGAAAHRVATNVYSKTPHGWRIVLHHVSLAPGPMPTPANPPSSLH